MKNIEHLAAERNCSIEEACSYRDACMAAHAQMSARLDEMTFGELMERSRAANPGLRQMLVTMTVHFNKSLCKLTGVTHPSELVSPNAREFEALRGRIYEELIAEAQR